MSANDLEWKIFLRNMSSRKSVKIVKMINWFNSDKINLQCSYVLQRVQNSFITLKIGPLGTTNSKMGCYIKIGPVLAEKWRIVGDRK